MFSADEDILEYPGIRQPHYRRNLALQYHYSRKQSLGHMAFLPQSFSASFFDMADSDFVRRAASSPQLVRVRARSSSASSSASLTATEDNYTRLRARPSASTSQFSSAYPTAWPFSSLGASVPAGHDTRHDTEREDISSGEEPVENDGLLFMSSASSPINTSGAAGVRNRKSTGRRNESEFRMVTTARGQPCAGETETEFDEMVCTVLSSMLLSLTALQPSRLPTSRNIRSSRSLDFFCVCLLESFRLLSVVPSFIGVVHNVHNVLHPPDTFHVRFSRVDYSLCVLWVSFPLEMFSG